MIQPDLDSAERATKPALLAGLMCRCPACGKGALFARYLKVVDRCASCGTDLHHQRADDGPAYLTILIVAHMVGFSLVPVMQTGLSPMVMALTVSLVAVVLALLLLPRMKGLFVAVQWAKRMHGFGVDQPVQA